MDKKAKTPKKPKTAKRLFFDVIPRAVDEYLTFAEKLSSEEPAKRLENPAWHIHAGKTPDARSALGFNLLLNLAGVANAETAEVMWGFISRYAPEATPENSPFLDKLAGYAVRYYQDQIKPTKRFRAPSDMERAALEDLAARLAALPAGADAEAIQGEVYAVGKAHPFADLKAWFQALYEVLLGQPTGPRMGSFIALYGVAETVALIKQKLATA